METQNSKNLHPGKNPASDIAVFKEESGATKVLLIIRGKNSIEAGKFALPGGFHDTYQDLSSEWKEDKETAKECAIRELLEETTLNLYELSNSITYIKSYKGVIDGDQKQDSWIITNLFGIILPENFNSFVVGGDDAEYALWYNLSNLDRIRLAFDHRKKILDSYEKLYWLR